MTVKKTTLKIVCTLLILVCTLPLVSGGINDAQSVSCPYPLRQLAMFNEKTGWGLSSQPRSGFCMA